MASKKQTKALVLFEVYGPSITHFDPRNKSLLPQPTEILLKLIIFKLTSFLCYTLYELCVEEKCVGHLE